MSTCHDTSCLSECAQDLGLSPKGRKPLGCHSGVCGFLCPLPQFPGSVDGRRWEPMPGV